MLHWFHFRSRAGTATALLALGGAVGVAAQTPPPAPSLEELLTEVCEAPPAAYGGFCDYLAELSSSQREGFFEQATPRENGAQGALLLNLPQGGYREAGRRLSSLRQAARLTGRMVAAVPPAGEARLAALDAAAAGSWFGAAGLSFTQDPEPPGGVPLEVEETARWGFFGSARRATTDRDPSTAEEGYDSSVQGGTLGVDRRLSGDRVIGAVLATQQIGLDLDEDGGGIDGDGGNLTLFFSRAGRSAYLQAVAGYGWLDFDSHRHVDLLVPFEGRDRWTVRGSTSNRQWMADLLLGREQVFGAVRLEWFGRASLVDGEIESATEDGMLPFAYSLDSQSVRSLLSELGLDWSRAISVDWGVVQPQLRLGWVHEFEADSRRVRAALQGDSQDRSFLFATNEPDRDYLNLGLGLSFTTVRGWSFFAAWDRDLQRQGVDTQTVNLGLRKEL